MQRLDATAFLHPSIPIVDYIADRLDLPPTLNSSVAHLLLTRSAAHARWASPQIRPGWTPDDDRSYDVGTATHAVLLENKELTPLPFADYRSKAAQFARDEAKAHGAIPVLQHQASDIACMVANARALMAVSPDLTGLGPLLAEQTVVWKIAEPDVWARCRPDWLSADHKVIVSVKTTRASAEPDAFLKTILGMGADLQAAFELAGVEAATGVRPSHYIWLAIEVDEPFACSLIGMSPMLLDLAERKRKRAFDLWAHCLTTGEFPGYGEHVAYPDPPEWALVRFAERYGITDPNESLEVL